jgi:hypothetical protein
MISRRRIEASRKKLPGRVKVRVYSIRPGDDASGSKPVKAERRPVTIQEQRSQDAAGNATNSEYVFFQVDLGSRVLKEGDVIEDIEKRIFVAIDSLSVELLGARIRARCYPTVNPIVQVDD